MPEHPSLGRIHLIDELRGLALIAMVVYHTLYDLEMMYQIPLGLYANMGLILFQACIAGVFIFLSGLSSELSRNNLRRGVVCFACGAALTLFTFLFMKEYLIQFGILHLLGLSMILYSVLQPLVQKIPPAAGLILFGLLFLFTYGAPQGYVGIPGVVHILLPRSWYTASPYLFPLGFPHPSFWSSDYFSLLPWFFLFLAGACLGRPAKERRLPAFCYRSRLRPLAFVGRHTLLIYLAHQPVIYGILWLGFGLVRGF